MKNLPRIFTVALMIISNLTFGKNLSGSNNKITGTWLGILKVSGMELRIVFNIKENDKGILSAYMESPDQTSHKIPVDTVIFNDGNLKLDVKIVRGYFDGKFNSDSMTIAGTWHQNGMSLPLALKKVEKVEAIKRPQEPKPPFPYKVENVTFKNNSAGVALAGTLTLPKKGGSFPAVLLISGSGPNNRNEEIFGHKPFLVLADYLTRRGIAVLRYDKRGIGKSTGNYTEATTKDFASDALAGVEYLRTLNIINPKEIGLVGHSEGGAIAPIVAAGSNDVAYIVLLAGPGLPGDQILLKQEALIAGLAGVPEKTVERDTSFKSKIFNLIKENKNAEQTISGIKKIVSNYYNTLSEKEKTGAGSSDELQKEMLKAFTSPWIEYFIRYNPVPTLEKVKCPVLALDGSKDVQVPPKEDLAAIKAALKKGGNKNFEVRELPGLNHLFQDATTGAPSEYSKIEETFSPAALKIIGDWIVKIVNK